SIRRSFRMFNQELRTNMNNFKVNEKSTESYKQAIKDLNGTLDSQKKNLNNLVKEYDKLQEEGKGNSRQAQNLATEISKQADNINYLEHQLGKVNKEFEEFQRQQRIAESGWGKLGQSFKDVGNQMSSIGQSFKDVGSQIQSVGSSLTNKITKPAVRSEISKQADNINYLEHQLGKVNKEFEEFQRQQRIAESGWGKLGQSFKDVGNQMSSIGQSFKDVGSQIQSVGSSLTNKITKPAV